MQPFNLADKTLR